MRDIKTEQFQRSFTVEKRAIDEEKRTVELAFSSEEPYERWFGIEILDHSEKSIRLDRLRNGGAVLVNHDTGDQVGVVENVQVSSDRKARAVVRFGKSERASEIFNDVQDGIRQLVSVGYAVHKYDVERKGEDGELDQYRMTDWEPYEISIVSVPADTTVGVGRSHTQEVKPMATEPKEKPEEKQVEKIDTDAIRTKARKDELERVRGISSLGERHDLGDMAESFIDDGKSLADFRAAALEEIGKRNVETRAKRDPEESEHLDLSEKEIKDYSLIRAMYALANPNNAKAQEAAAYEYEVSNAGAEKLGIQARGLFVPVDITNGLKRTLSAGTATDGAELVATNLLAGQYIEVLRNRMAVMQRGATFLDGLVGNVDIPRQTSGASATWVTAEDGDATVSDPQFDQVALTPKDLACYTEVTRRLMMQSTPAIEGLVMMDLAMAAALGIDLAALYGSGASGQPEGIANVTGIGSVTFAAADPTYAEVVGLETAVAVDNADVGTLGYITDAAMRGAFKTTEKATGTAQFIWEPGNTVNGYECGISNQVTDGDVFFGNWADLIIGQWGGLEINVDPYTHSLKGKTRFVMFQTVDAAVRHPESFALGNDGV